MLSIFKREIKSYFLSAIGYIFLSVFYLFAGYCFYATSIMARSADLKYVFSNLLVILIFLLPMLTMRLMSEDKKMKTDQLLLTAPVNLSSVVVGKFLAALATLFIGVMITIIYGVVLSFFAKFDWISLFCNIIGLLLLGGALISIGIFVSSLTENQVISAIASCAIILILFFIDGISSTINISFISKILSSLSIVQPYNEFTYGSFSLPNVVLFLGIITVFLFLTTRVLERRRWAD